MKINFWIYVLIALLVACIPLYKNWELILYGTTTPAKIIDIHYENTNQLPVSYVIIKYQYNNLTFLTKGPKNIKFSIGDPCKVVLLPHQPKQAILYHFKGLYFNKYTHIALFGIIIWTAIYFSFSKKNARRESEKIRSSKKCIYKNKQLV